MRNNSRFELMPAQLGKSLVARRSNWDYTGKKEQSRSLQLDRLFLFEPGIFCC